MSDNGSYVIYARSEAQPLGDVWITEVLGGQEAVWVRDIERWLRGHPEKLKEFSANIFVPLGASPKEAFDIRMATRMNRLTDFDPQRITHPPGP